MSTHTRGAPVHLFGSLPILTLFLELLTVDVAVLGLVRAVEGGCSGLWLNWGGWSFPSGKTGLH